MITLIGHGYVGSYISKKLTQKFEWITHKDLPSKHTSFIINAAGYIGFPNVDACEKNKNLCIDANVLFPLRLEKTYKVPILHVSTGCVYIGYKENGWLETDTPNFTFDNGSFYNGSKSLLQELLQIYMTKSYLFRFRLPFGPKKDSRNLLTKIEQYNKLINKENSMTQIEDLAQVVNFFANERPDPGIYNVCNTGSVTTKIIASMMNLSEKQWISDEEFRSMTVAPRSNCVLNVDKLKVIYPMRSVYDALDQTIKEYKND